MIGKIRKGSGFKGCVNYVLGKEQAALLHAEGILAESNRDIIRSFILQAGMNPDLKKPVGHIALSYSPVDAPKLTDGKMIQLAQEYMREMKITDTQYIIVRHQDREHPHVHIVFNRIDNNGKTISDRSKNTNFRSYIQLYKYISGSLTEAEKDESGNDVYVYRTTRHTERQTEGGCDWKVSGYFIVSPDIVNSEGEAGAQTMDWATANGYLTAANTNIYSTPSFAVAKGCAAYRGKEGLDEPGTWRVPTRGECALILLFYKKMEETKATTGFQPFALSTIGATYYWSATEKGGDSKDVWSMRFYPDNQITGYGLNTGYYDKQKKSYYLRCIRDIPLK